jgi:cyclopropane fatty-acyl-phospholipid synthase-like methyltransferase
MNQTCLDICAERFKYYPIEINYYLNDGRDCSMVSEKLYDLIATFDSMVHVHPDILHGYFEQWAKLLAPSGILFVDHSGKGIKTSGFRTATTDKMAQKWVEDSGLVLLDQHFRNDHDCITIARK